MASKTKTNYFPHDADARNDSNIVRLRMRHGAAGYGVYFMLLERLREESDYTAETDYEMLAFDLRVDTDLVRSVIYDFGLFVVSDDGTRFYSDRLKRCMEVKDEVSRKRSESGKHGVQVREAKQNVSKCDAKYKQSISKPQANASENVSKPQANASENVSKPQANASENVSKCFRKHKQSDSDRKKEKEKEEKETPLFPHTPITLKEKEKEKEKEDTQYKSREFQKKTASVFHKPTIEEVQSYINEKGYTMLDAEKFWNFYEAKGWMIGKNHMKNWHAAIATWIRQTNAPNYANSSTVITNSAADRDGHGESAAHFRERITADIARIAAGETAAYEQNSLPWE